MWRCGVLIENREEARRPAACGKIVCEAGTTAHNHTKLKLKMAEVVKRVGKLKN
jgi:hypothetical protein